MKKILLTGSRGMLATDFIKYYGKIFNVIPLDLYNGDITDMDLTEKMIKIKKPDIILNFAAHTNVENAEDIGQKNNFDVNSLGVYNLAKISSRYKMDFITISTDYVFDGNNKKGYKEKDKPNPINSYGMAKYLGEELSRKENPNTIIIRTSWMYGGGKKFNNFVNNMLNLSENRHELKVVNDQIGSPTYTIDLCEAIVKIINNLDNYKGTILHFCNNTEGNGISRFEFAKEIFRVAGVKITLIPCSSEEFITKAKRPKLSKLLNGSDIILRDRKEGIKDYLKTIS